VTFFKSQSDTRYWKGVLKCTYLFWVQWLITYGKLAYCENIEGGSCLAYHVWTIKSPCYSSDVYWQNILIVSRGFFSLPYWMLISHVFIILWKEIFWKLWLWTEEQCTLYSWYLQHPAELLTSGHTRTRQYWRLTAPQRRLSPSSQQTLHSFKWSNFRWEAFTLWINFSTLLKHACGRITPYIIGSATSATDI
jgi:hypothetical protein